MKALFLTLEQSPDLFLAQWFSELASYHCGEYHSFVYLIYATELQQTFLMDGFFYGRVKEVAIWVNHYADIVEIQPSSIDWKPCLKKAFLRAKKKAIPVCAVRRQLI